MKKRYLAVILLLLFSSMLKISALTVDDCEVLASYKLYSSLDEENYLELSNLIHSHEDFTLDELVDEYFNSTNDADEENESDSETT